MSEQRAVEGDGDDAGGRAWWTRGEALSTRERRQRALGVAGWCALLVAMRLFEGSPADGVVICPVRAWTGYSCFGCGMTRACGAWMHGQWADSIAFHPFGWALIACGCVWATARGVEAVWGARIAGRGARLWRRYRSWAWGGALVAVVIFGGARAAFEIAGILTPI